MSILQSLESLFNTDASSEEFAWYADLLLSQGDAAKALEVLEHGLESHPDLLTALLVKSKCLDQLGQIDEAIQLCAHILEIDDRCLAARVYLYHNALKQGQNAAALKIHQRIVLQDPWTTIPAPEANTSTPIAAAAVAAPLAFAAPPLVDDLFGEESIADELFENPPIPDSVAAPIQATPSADDLGPLNLGENLPSSEEVGMAFESLFGASGVDEILPEPTAELDLGDELSEPIIAQDPQNHWIWLSQLKKQLLSLIWTWLQKMLARLLTNCLAMKAWDLYPKNSPLWKRPVKHKSSNLQNPIWKLRRLKSQNSQKLHFPN